MTVTATMIGYVSPYRVDEAGPFTSALFQYYVLPAAALLTALGLETTSALYDHCHALMIAHLYAVRGGETDLLSFESGGLSWSKSVTIMEQANTPQLLEIRRIIADLKSDVGGEIMGAAVPLTNVIRADADVGNLKLDRTTSPVFYRGV